MLGAILGDIIGSPYEFSREPIEEREFPLFREDSDFTDDTVMTLAIADALMEGEEDKEKTRALFISKMRKLGRFYANAGYGEMFMQWLCRQDDEPYNSFGNGSAMRVSPVAWMFDNLDKVEEFAELSAEVTHNHPEGIKGAKAVAAAIYMARTGSSRFEIKKYIETKYGYDLDRTIEDIRAYPQVSASCQITVPQAIIAFLESEDMESAIRKAVSLGGDTDTLAAITGSIAEAYYSVSDSYKKEIFKRIPSDLMPILERWQALMRKKKTQRMYYDEAYKYAELMHEDQKRIGGEAYFTHPAAVAEILNKRDFPLEYRIAGLFHDLLEVTDAEEDRIMAYGGPEVLEAVKIMTKEYYLDMETFINRVKSNPIAMNVKGADRVHNLTTAVVTDWRFKKRFIEETRKWYYDFPGWEEEIKAKTEALEATIPEEYRYKKNEEIKKSFGLDKLFGMSSNVLKMLDKGAFLTTKSGQKKNTMVISWGAVGEMWGKPMIMIMIRRSRYTRELLDDSSDFTVSFADPEKLKDELDFCGKESGRNVNKFAKLGLVTKDSKYVEASIIDTPALHFECKTFYKTEVTAEGLTSAEDYDEFYSDGDMHTLYFAEIVEAYETE
ncbi:MAG: ADP-ribosylglycohydrolase family protein [Firmicutes bacterium]|nr:ADP-ribosylglycohydrolase family protein [Bacillota bacterium]